MKGALLLLWCVCYQFILAKPDNRFFYLGYYSASCQCFAYAEHLWYFQKLMAYVGSVFSSEANVNMLLHQILDNMLSFAARVMSGKMENNEATTRWAFEQIYSFVAPNVRTELLEEEGKKEII
ncbi:MAG: hypothetical protein ACI4N0_05890 [Christensenellales bacterium]